MEPLIRAKYATEKVVVSKIRGILRDRKYIGVLESSNLPEAVKGDWRPIVDPEVFEEIERRRTKVEHVQHNSKLDIFPLKAVLICADCGRRMTGTEKKKKGRTYRYYECQKCNGTAVNVDDAHEQFVSVLAQLGTPADLLDELATRVRADAAKEVERLSRERDALLLQVADVENRRDRVIDAWVDKTLGLPEYQTRLARCDDDLAALRESLRAIPCMEGFEDDCLAHCSKVLSDPAQSWISIAGAKRAEFAAALLINGIEVKDKTFRTTIPLTAYRVTALVDDEDQLGTPS